MRLTSIKSLAADRSFIVNKLKKISLSIATHSLANTASVVRSKGEEGE